MILEIHGALLTSTRGEAFRTELEPSLLPDAFTSTSWQALPSFYQGVREVRRSRGVRVDPSGVSRNAPLSIRGIRQIWPISGAAISHARGLNEGYRETQTVHRSQTYCSTRHWVPQPSSRPA